MKQRCLSLLIAVLCCPFIVSAASIPDDTITSPPLKEALLSLEANRKAEAAGVLSSFRPDSSTLAQYYFVSARVMRAEQKPIEAVMLFRKAYLFSPPGSLKEQSLMERAETYLSMRYFYEARAVYLVFLRQFPGSALLPRVYPSLARSLAESGALKEALEYYEKSGASPEVLMGKANILHRLGMYQEADRAYAALFRTNETLLLSSDESLYFLGENMRQMERQEEAVRYLSAVRNQPFMARAVLSLGLISLQQERDGRKFLNDALASGNRETRRQALLALADCDLKWGNKEDAKRRLEEIRIRYPYGRDYEEAILRLSRILIGEGSLDRAIPLLRELSYTSSLRKEALSEFENMVVQARSRDKEEFARIWKAAGPLLLDASRERFLFDTAEELMRSGNPFLDILLYLSKYGTEPGKRRSLVILAGHYAEKGDIPKTEDCLAKLKEMKGSGDDILRIEARIVWIKGDYRVAAETILRLKALLAGDIRVLGDALAADHEIPKALARYEKAVKETGGDVRSYTVLANIMYDKGRNKDALGYYRNVLSKEPNNDWALYRIGSLTEGEEAEELLRKVSRKDTVITKLAETRLRELDLTKKGLEKFR